MADIRKFSGRDEALTEFINRRIVSELAITSDDCLVDIGCGDGTLLRLAEQNGATSVIGLSGSEEEADCLRQRGLNVKQAHTDLLPLPSGSASVVVCNGVLHIVPPEKVPISLREIARIAKTGARIWIGEIPPFREAASLRAFKSVHVMLWWLLRNRGLRTFLGMLRRLLTGAQRGPILATAQAFWSEPDEFIRMAAEAGLTIERHFPQKLPHNYPPGTTARNDYVFRKQ